MAKYQFTPAKEKHTTCFLKGQHISVDQNYRSILNSSACQTELVSKSSILYSVYKEVANPGTEAEYPS